LLGNYAQGVFIKYRDELIDNGSKIRAICMPHPSHTIGYISLKVASENLKDKFRPYNATLKRYFFKSKKNSGWRWLG
jgi:hypothetical protein